MAKVGYNLRESIPYLRYEMTYLQRLKCCKCYK